MPVETRRAAKRRRVANGPLLGDNKHGDIPSCVLGRILGFLDIASLVQVGGCNSVLRKQVYDEHKKELWRVIDFGKVPCNVAARITDCQLASILQNCHARDCCQVIRLSGCFGLRGSGLEPLRGSCWLREADLRFAIHLEPTAPSVDTDIVLPILSSMPPMAAERVPLPENSGSLGLALVRFQHENNNTNYYDQFHSRAAANWLRRFHQTLQEKAIESRTKCDHCQDVIMEKCKREDRSWIMAACYCERCMKYTCPDWSCSHGPASTHCDVCLLQCCQPCGDSNNSLCPNHTFIINCDSCFSSACEACHDDGYFDGRWCDADECGNFFCNDCGDDHLVYCETCEECFCLECNDEHQKECSSANDNDGENLTESSSSSSSSSSPSSD